MQSEWRDCALGEAITLKRGYDLPAKERRPGAVPIVSSSGFSDLHSDAMVKGPGVVTGRYGTIGQVFYVSQDFWPLNTTLYVQDFKGNDPRFVSYMLRTVDFHQFSDKAAVPGVNRNHLHTASIRLPPLAEQVRISQVLQSLDDRIDLLRQANATLESIAQALFKSWFIDFDPVRAKAEGREPEGMDTATAALFPAEFEESALGLIPKGWTYRPAEELFDVGIGKTPPRKEPHWFSEGSGDMRWLSIKDMGDEGTIASRSSEFLSSEAVTRFNVRVVPSRTVLMSFKLTVGRLSITDGPMCTNEAIAHFKAREGSPQFTYLYCYLKAFDFRTLGSTSSIADATNSKAVKALPVLFPSSRLVDAFHRTSAEMFEKMFVQKSHCRRLEELRDTLLPRLISGKLRLPEALEAAEAVAA